jgi:hypothetical protein
MKLSLNEYEPPEDQKETGAQDGYEKNKVWNFPGHVVTGGVYGRRHLDIAITGIYRGSVGKSGKEPPALSWTERACHLLIGIIEYTPFLGAIAAVLDRELTAPAQLKEFKGKAGKTLGWRALSEDDPVRKLLAKAKISKDVKERIKEDSNWIFIQFSSLELNQSDRKERWKKISQEIAELYKAGNYEDSEGIDLNLLNKMVSADIDREYYHGNGKRE